MKAPVRESTVERVLVTVGLFVLALCVRALTWQNVLTEQRVFLYGNDAYYHLRRIAWSVANFPSVLAFDPYINYPDGAAPIWTPLFDWLVALFAFPIARGAVLAGELHQLERVAVWLPPVIGAGTVVAFYAILRRDFGKRVALAAALVLCVMSGHVWYSQIGFVDHHVAVAFVSTVLLGSGIRLLGAPGQLAVVATGAASAFALALWPGMLLHVALLEIALIVDWGWRSEGREAAARARRFGALNALAFVLLLPLCLASEHPQWGRFSPVVLSGFQPWLFAFLAVLGSGCATLFPRGRAGGRSRRLLVATLLALALLGTSLVAAPGLGEGPAEAWEWLSRRDSFQALVNESLPLVTIDRGRPAFGLAMESLSLFLFVLPIALVAFVCWARRQARTGPFLFVAGWTIALCCMALVQRRFVNSASIAVSLLFGWSVIHAYAWLASGRSARRRPVALAVAAATLGALVPVFAGQLPYVSSLFGFRSEGSAPLSRPEVRRRITLETGDWLRENTQETEGWLGVAARPSYGVLARWTFGHPLGYSSRRPTVSNNFGNDIGERNYELAHRYFRLDEKRAVPVLEKLRVRYVAVDWHRGDVGEEPRPDSMVASLYLRNGNPFVDEHDREIVPALRRHRLVYESRPFNPKRRNNPPLLKVFELVKGARVTGRAPSGATVAATLVIRSNRQREFEYRSRVAVEEDGRYHFVLPYSNVGSPTGLRVSASYSIDCGDEKAQLVVEERDVISGADVEGPDLCLGRS